MKEDCFPFGFLSPSAYLLAMGEKSPRFLSNFFFGLLPDNAAVLTDCRGLSEMSVFYPGGSERSERKSGSGPYRYESHRSEDRQEERTLPKKTLWIMDDLLFPDRDLIRNTSGKDFRISASPFNMPPYHHCFLKNQRSIVADFSVGRKPCIFNTGTPLNRASEGNRAEN